MSQDHTRLPPTRGEGQGPLAERIAHLEAALLHIAETDRHYRTPPKPHADGGLRGWAGHHAVWALTGLNGSYTGDAEVREALTARTSAVPDDVARLVVAARIVAHEDQGPEALNELDQASEAFAARVRWDDEPETPSAAGQSLTEASVYGSSPLIDEAHPPGGNSHEG